MIPLFLEKRETRTFTEFLSRSFEIVRILKKTVLPIYSFSHLKMRFSFFGLIECGIVSRQTIFTQSFGYAFFCLSHCFFIKNVCFRLSCLTVCHMQDVTRFSEITGCCWMSKARERYLNTFFIIVVVIGFQIRFQPAFSFLSQTCRCVLLRKFSRTTHLPIASFLLHNSLQKRYLKYRCQTNTPEGCDLALPFTYYVIG